MSNESIRYRHLTTQYLFGNGVDLGSGGTPVVPWAMSMDLPMGEFLHYRSNNQPENAIHLQGDARNLHWFRDGVLDFVYSSHLLEDFFDWDPILREWARVIKPGGYLVILVPDKELFAEAISKGQPPNCAHTHESRPGELSEHIERIGGFEIIQDQLTECHPGDYTVLFIAKKL